MKTKTLHLTVHRLIVSLSIGLCSHSALALEPLSDVSLKQAIQKTLDKHPDLAQYPFDIRYQQALSHQANLTPTPQLSVEAEDLLGTKDYGFGERTELTLTLSQNYEMGEKRQHRLALSQSKEDSKRLEFELAKTDIASETSRRFYDVIYLQQLSQLTEQQLEEQRALYQKINRLAQAGIANPVDQNRMNLRIKQTQHQALSISNQQSLAKMRLSAMWQSETDFNQAKGTLQTHITTPKKATLIESIEQSPVQLHYLALQREADYTLKLEQAYGVQDVTYSVGVRHKAFDNAQTLNVGISIPLAFHNPNQGRIDAAKVRLEESQSNQQPYTQQLKLEVLEYWQSMQNMTRRLRDIEQVLLPEAKRLIANTLASYQRGITPLFQVMEAQQTWFDLKTQQLELHKQSHLTLLEMERLMGRPVSANSKGN